ncbi:hypothetical protein M1N44_03625 [Dehalococcoidia bacterium]|nr:hypothetical protein [Dehalococcoidia bacterium]
MPLFDVYMAVDFTGSANVGVQRDRIAFAELERGATPDVRKGFTRSTVADHLLERIIDHNQRGKRVLVGFDFQYSFPKGFWNALTGLPESWASMLQGMAKGVAGLPSVREEPKSNAREWARKANERIACRLRTKVGPFWGPHFSPQPTDPKFPFSPGIFEKFRAVENLRAGFKPIFQLGGQGTVGLQSLCGMPHLFYLRNNCFKHKIALHCWPFDGWNPNNSAHFLVEWYPAIQNQGRKSDEQDAKACVEWARDVDEKGQMSKYLLPNLPDNDKAKAAVEGWVLGVV